MGDDCDDHDDSEDGVEYAFMLGLLLLLLPALPDWTDTGSLFKRLAAAKIDDLVSIVIVFMFSTSEVKLRLNESSDSFELFVFK